MGVGVGVGVEVAVAVAVAVAVNVGVGVEMNGRLEGSEQARAANTPATTASARVHLRCIMPDIINERLPSVNLAVPTSSC